ncbi:beta-glucuronidase [Arachnia propionica]|uniref:Beta-glucuronidase n=1 Tax=Arachnia propionica TaxID=1750 RepID=A0A3P1TC41_9ACTN|nr:beta-glucuronidase [Arachnia propionica]RRD06053.1 beta-glucuronidase [Arachnia propionica]
MLFPRTSPSRTVTPLDGVWEFQLDADGREAGWAGNPLPEPRPMPVPSSYNDVTVSPHVHDHVGEVWYQRRVQAPRLHDGDRLHLWFGAATHAATVWVNGQEVARHVGGYLPFEADITDHVVPGESFLLTVAVDNRLSWQSIPPGYLEVEESGIHQRYFHDFYNYAGLHRGVKLITRPAVAVSDVTITTELDGTVNYRVVADGARQIGVRILDAQQQVVARAEGAEGRVKIPEVTLWEPGRGYLYTLEVIADDDLYPQPFGVRTVEVRDSQFLINGRPFHFKGYGRHEDNLVRGKGHDDVMMVHDFELMRWQGANSFRTSHYPYADEVMDFADQQGIVVIDETAAVGLNIGISGGIFGSPNQPTVTFSQDTINAETQRVHEAHIRELIARDKNHPSVVLWSIANEPESHTDASRSYFEPLAAAAREADPSRPVGYVNVMISTPDKERIIDLFDVVMLNRYYGWYWQNNDLVLAESLLRQEIQGWISLCPGKPVIFTEYGPDTLAGMRDLQARPWSEDYQEKFFDMYHRVFDEFPEVVGEQTWNFADFQTIPGIMRVGGNRKGMFTRDRTPKAAAYKVRERWLGGQNG